MKRRAVFQLRLTEQEAQRLDREAMERGVSKADLIRSALGWETTERPTRSAPIRDTVTSAPTKTIDPDLQPGLAAIQQIAKKLKGKR